MAETSLHGAVADQNVAAGPRENRRLCGIQVRKGLNEHVRELPLHRFRDLVDETDQRSGGTALRFVDRRAPFAGAIDISVNLRDIQNPALRVFPDQRKRTLLRDADHVRMRQAGHSGAYGAVAGDTGFPPEGIVVRMFFEIVAARTELPHGVALPGGIGLTAQILRNRLSE